MYIVRYKALKDAIEPERKKVKLIEPVLWKKAWSEGIEDWRPGHEIRNNNIAMSLFTTGSRESLHYHCACWEIYQVLEGQLKIAIKPTKKGEWEAFRLHQFDMTLIGPGTRHIVDASSKHVSQVFQAPPSSGEDQRIITETEEEDAARQVLNKV